MPPEVEFVDRVTYAPLRFEPSEGWYVDRQYRHGQWIVRTLSDSIGTPHIRLNEIYIPLHTYDGQPRSFVLPEHSIEAVIAQNIARFAAILCLYSQQPDGSYRPLAPTLFIEPASLTPTELDMIVGRIQQLSLLASSPVISRNLLPTQGVLKTNRNQQGITGDTDSSIVEIGIRCLGVLEALTENWPLVCNSPAKETVLSPQYVDASESRKPLSASVARKAHQRPDQRRVEVLVRQESFDNPENRFLVFVLLDITKYSAIIAQRLDDRATELQLTWNAANRPGGQRQQGFIQDWDIGQRRKISSAAKMAQLAFDIRERVERVMVLRKASFLQAASAKPILPRVPSDRLARSSDYGPIYGAYMNYVQVAKHSIVPMKQGLEIALARRAIHPTAHLYETWVLIELYDMLISRFGFSADVGTTPHPLQLINVNDGDLDAAALSGHSFRLSLTLPGEDTPCISIALHYDRERAVRDCLPGKKCYDARACPQLPCYDKIMTRRHWQTLRPDILIEATGRPNTSKTWIFSVDAKYRRYSNQRLGYPSERATYQVDSVFDLDVLGTSVMKYMDGLGSDAAFIIHSDPEPQYSFWGQDQYRTIPHRLRTLNRNTYPAHRYGAVFATPSNTRNIERLLKCFFMYHMGIVNICWSCRRRVQPVKDYMERLGRDGQLRRFSVGDCYQCSECHAYWVDTWCQGNPDHRILKLGNDTFHKPSPGKQGLYDCPTCGSKHESVNEISPQF